MTITGSEGMLEQTVALTILYGIVALLAFTLAFHRH